MPVVRSVFIADGFAERPVLTRIGVTLVAVSESSGNTSSQSDRLLPDAVAGHDEVSMPTS
jgi:hypothetical protein